MCVCVCARLTCGPRGGDVVPLGRGEHAAAEAREREHDVRAERRVHVLRGETAPRRAVLTPAREVTHHLQGR